MGNQWVVSIRAWTPQKGSVGQSEQAAPWSIALRQVLSNRVCWYEYWYMHNTVGSHHRGDEYSPLPPPRRTHCFSILFSSIFHSQHKSSEIHGKERYLHNFYVSWALHGEGNTIGNSGYWALDKTKISLKAQQRSWQGHFSVDDTWQIVPLTWKTYCFEYFPVMRFDCFEWTWTILFCSLSSLNHLIL